jgi:hypothetical protein
MQHTTQCTAQTSRKVPQRGCSRITGDDARHGPLRGAHTRTHTHANDGSTRTAVPVLSVTPRLKCLVSIASHAAQARAQLLARKKPDSLIEAAQLVAEQQRQACKQKEELAESDEVAATTRSTPRVGTRSTHARTRMQPFKPAS